MAPNQGGTGVTTTHLAIILLSLASAMVLLFVLMAAGARLRGLARCPLPGELKAPVDFLVGCWLYAMLALAVGFAGWFRGPVLIALVAALLACGRWRRRGWRLSSLLPPSLTALVLLPVALSEPFFYDALVYHLALPWQSLVEGRISAHGEDLFASFPPLAQLVFAAPVAAGLDRGAAALHLGTFVLGGAAVAGLARRLGASRPWARGAGALLPLLPAVVLVPGFPAAEGFAAVGVVASFAIALPAVRGPRRRAALAASAAAGALAGIASAARLQGVPWTLILLLILLAGSAPRLRHVLSAAGGWVLGSAPWWIKNLLLLGDPLAPIGWRRAGIETLWRDSRGLMHGAAEGGEMLLALWNAMRPHLTYVAPLALAAVVAVVMTRHRPPGRPAPGGSGSILLASGLGTVAWCLTGSLPRFWAPSLALLLALAAAASAGKSGRWVAGGAFVLTGFLGLAQTARETGRLGGLRLLLPGEAARSLIINNPLPAFEAAVRFANADGSTGPLPRDARVLFVSEPRSYRFPRRALVPSQHDPSPLRHLVETSPGASEVRDRLLEQGVTHLLVNRAEMARLTEQYPVLPWETSKGRERFQDLLNLCGAPIVKAGETAIFALR